MLIRRTGCDGRAGTERLSWVGSDGWVGWGGWSWRPGVVDRTVFMMVVPHWWGAARGSGIARGCGIARGSVIYRGGASEDGRLRRQVRDLESRASKSSLPTESLATAPLRRRAGRSGGEDADEAGGKASAGHPRNICINHAGSFRQWRWPTVSATRRTAQVNSETLS